jgi:DNA-binding response OmpR family regulator
VNTQARILSIEDDPEMSGLIQLIFERKGHRVIGARRGELGLELIKSLKPDVLLLDLMLPDIDGWDLYRQMKDDKELAKVPIIIVSARSEEQDAASGLRVVNHDRFIQKPFEVKELIDTVTTMLERSPVG